MPELEAPARPFTIGDRVQVRRNLDHPAWMNYVTADLKDGGSRWVRRDDLAEALFEGTIDQLAYQNFRDTVRVAENLHWYEQATGEQHGSGATYIVHLDPAPDPDTDEKE